MRIKVYPGDDGGCGRYRIIYPAKALQAVGRDVEIAEPGDDDFKFIQMDGPDGGKTVAAMDPSAFPDADLCVIQRPLFDTTWQFIRAFQQHGIRMVVDLDDDFDSLHPNNPAAISCRKHHPRLSPANIHRAVAQADLTVVATPRLAQVYGRSARRIVVVENRVPSSFLDVRNPDRTDAIGWSGSTSTHIGDLDVLGPSLGRLQDLGREVMVVGPEPSRQQMGLRRPARFTGWVPIDDYPHAMAGIGVGMVPLRLSAFNEAKSWLKGLEFAALGVPVVASPTGEYTRLHQDGFVAGLACKPKDWFRMLRDLQPCDGDRLRDRVRVLGYTYEDRVADWWDAWTSALSD